MDLHLACAWQLSDSVLVFHETGSRKYRSRMIRLPLDLPTNETKASFKCHAVNTTTLRTLRSIAYVFAWTASQHPILVPGFLGS